MSVKCYQLRVVAMEIIRTCATARLSGKERIIMFAALFRGMARTSPLLQKIKTSSSTNCRRTKKSANSPRVAGNLFQNYHDSSSLDCNGFHASILIRVLQKNLQLILVTAEYCFIDDLRICPVEDMAFLQKRCA